MRKLPNHLHMGESYIAPYLLAVDHLRRVAGDMMEYAGLAPAPTPSRIALARDGFRLLAFGNTLNSGTILLILPAPIKRWYIWDLWLAVSVVQCCLKGDIGVYVIDWKRPGSHQQWGLEYYADQFISECLNVIAHETGQHCVFLAAHSLGGTLAAIFASLHPDWVRGLVLLESPVKFATAEGALDRLVAILPRADRITNVLGNVPGCVLNAGAYLASPRSFDWDRQADWLAGWMDPQAIRTHALVERWSLDESPMASHLFGQVVDRLYREDQFMRGQLEVSGRPALPGDVDAPILSIAQSGSDVVPPESILAFHDAVASQEKRVLWYEGDVGVALQHVGPLVGRRAHRELWPQITRWIVERS